MSLTGGAVVIWCCLIWSWNNVGWAKERSDVPTIFGALGYGGY